MPIQAPIEGPDDHALVVTRMLLSIVPAFGSLANEYLNGIGGPLQRRLLTWAAEVTAVLNDMQRLYSISPEEALENEAFVSFAIQASQVAAKTHQKAKLDALRNALLASGAVGAPEEDVMFQFLRYIEELTPSHLLLLRAIKVVDGRETLEDLYTAVVDLKMDFPNRAFFRSCIEDLASRYLLTLGDAAELPEFEKGNQSIIIEQSEPKPLAMTRLGQDFLNFVEDVGASS